MARSGKEVALKSVRSRRDLLTKAAGALGVVTMGALARGGSAARAADGDPLILGAANSETGSTTITATGADSAITLDAQSTLHGAFDVLNHRGDAVWGRSVSGLGVLGNSTEETGVKGESDSVSGVHGVAHAQGAAGVVGDSEHGAGVVGNAGIGNSVFDRAGVVGNGGDYGVIGTGSDVGVWGNSTTGIGVAGDSRGTNTPGVSGISATGDGVYGESGSSYDGTPGTQNGVHGVTKSSNDAGVFGEALASGATGVQGTNVQSTGTGVSGRGQTGVSGQPLAGGIGVLASAAQDGSGAALRAVGPTLFSLSGRLSIVANGKSGTVAGVSLRPESLVFATVQNDVGVGVESVVVDVAGSTITINLAKAVSAGKTARVAWFVVN
jgi:hypothetical protein